MADKPVHGTPTVRAAFIAVTTLFFAWGFITSLIDPLRSEERRVGKEC